MSANLDRRLFGIHRILADDSTTPAAIFALELRSDGRVAYVELQYLPDYLASSDALALMPTLPLQTAPFDFTCSGDGVPGFIDELLPDSWGRHLIARELTRRGLQRNPTIADLLSHASGSPVGGFVCCPWGQEPPSIGNGLRLSESASVIRSAHRIDRNEGTAQDFERLRIAGGSSPKGARPKFLAFDDKRYWLVKLARASDTYDVIQAEHAALSIAREAGLETPRSEIAEIDGELVLLVERFDRTDTGERLHLLSANAFLKDPTSHQDRLHASYDNLADLIRRYSVEPTKDLRQLLGQALLNNALRNTDDHLRNFSFLIDRRGVQLSPAYDIVPSPVVGAYHQLHWGHSPFLPTLKDAGEAARHIGIPASEGETLAKALREALYDHKKILEEAGAAPTIS